MEQIESPRSSNPAPSSAENIETINHNLYSCVLLDTRWCRPPNLESSTVCETYLTLWRNNIKKKEAIYNYKNKLGWRLFYFFDLFLYHKNKNWLISLNKGITQLHTFNFIEKFLLLRLVGIVRLYIIRSPWIISFLQNINSCHARECRDDITTLKLSPFFTSFSHCTISGIYTF